MSMKFIFPMAAHERQAKAYIQEFRDHGSPVHGSGGLDRFLKEDNYAGWLVKCTEYLDIANVPENWVPAITYFYADKDGGIVGMINIRLSLNDFLRREGGHIGYSIRPTQRGKGHATNMLRETLRFCAPIGLREVIVTCNKSNLASAKVITNCGGVLQEEFYSETFGAEFQRYLIRNETEERT
jgi:predicted acetyltransferase